MEIKYDKKSKHYFIGNSIFTKEEFIKYVEDDMLKGVLTDESCTLIDISNVKYLNFKKLLLWFVNQLNINNGVKLGAKHFSQGYENNKIRNYYSKWRDYGDFTLDCNFSGGFYSSISKNNYINVTTTGIDIRPVFDNNTKQVIKVQIALDNRSYTDDVICKFSDILEKEYLIDELSLLDDKTNDVLKDLFDKYYYLIKNLFLNLKGKAKEGCNVYFYGAPGCGKSHYVQKILNDLKVVEENRFRVTFHPEYSNVDFVGQILPVIKKDDDGKDIVTYEFNEGPFTKAIKRCYETNEMVYLIIEELNRGNAPAIFGDLFQLLDRVEDPESENYKESEYPVTNINIYNYLKKELGNKFSRDDGNIVIPSNLTIYATLNTSDQSVFALDTAFKRRWDEESISNEFTNDDGHPYKNFFIPGTDVTWKIFVEKINAKIVEPQLTNSSTEDKRLGKFFVKSNCLVKEKTDIDSCKRIAENFAHKVLEYIWNDVCRYNKSEWFDTSKYKTLEDLINGFMKEQLAIFLGINFAN